MAAAGLFLGVLLLGLRVVWLAVVCHGEFETRAERNQEQRVLVPPVRGSVLDRNGRPLARDLLTFSIAAAPHEMPDRRAVAVGLARLLHLDARRVERAFAQRPRYLFVARRVPPAIGEAVLAQKWPGVYATIATEREDLLGAAACEVVGRTDVDDAGLEGLELQYDDALRGHPGWTTLLRDGRGGEHALPGMLQRRPEDGHDVVTTLDADLQSIVESHLLRAVDTLQAKRAFAVFLDPRTGEILASVDAPHLTAGEDKNWAFTDEYEPGSTFKLVVAGAALEENVVRPDDYFDAGGGVYQVAPGAIFHDTHKAAGFTFRDAVRFSSNIVMGRIGLRVGPERLYRYATALGFGSMTGIEFPGEAGGRLRTPEQWSARSCPTIAIGHEVAVTPLQLALAYAAAANGGVLMEPMLVREVRDAQGHVLHRYSPRASHRVFSEATTRTLRTFLQSVVDSGTARPARVPGFPIAGKTGTAQKYDPRVHGYGKGMYLSSFAGFAPAQNPTLVGVVVIDEPHGKQYYGGEVAAPVFREVIQDLRRLPHGPFDVGSDQVAVRPPAVPPAIVPDVNLLPPHAAEARLEDAGLHAQWMGEGVRVLSQSPAAGEAVERGAGVTVWLSPPADSAGRVLPDLTGLAVREALRQLTVREVPARIEGAGVVVRQEPEPGTPLPLRGPCRLWCGPHEAVAAAHVTAGGPVGWNEVAGAPAVAMTRVRARPARGGSP
ncbi:MAG TPA: penicillin-binding transpeptidase domain-containing protein [Candidatus Eisenbacteria bacterium]|nr:penicillin-binding transpeptidase domain-containing protein [Candidatus Eisenbacteria bacterium]